MSTARRAIPAPSATTSSKSIFNNSLIPTCLSQNLSSSPPLSTSAIQYNVARVSSTSPRPWCTHTELRSDYPSATERHTAAPPIESRNIKRTPRTSDSRITVSTDTPALQIRPLLSVATSAHTRYKPATLSIFHYRPWRASIHHHYPTWAIHLISPTWAPTISVLCYHPWAFKTNRDSTIRATLAGELKCNNHEVHI